MLAKIKETIKKHSTSILFVAAWISGGLTGNTIGSYRATPHEYPGAIQTGFLVQCLGDKAWFPPAHDYCHCALAQIRQELSYAEFLQEVRKPRAQQNVRVTEGIEECKQKLLDQSLQESPKSDYVPM